MIKPLFENEKYVKAASNTATEAPTPESIYFGTPTTIQRPKLTFVLLKKIHFFRKKERIITISTLYLGFPANKPTSKLVTRSPFSLDPRNFEI